MNCEISLAIDSIIKRDKPVIFIDTCSLLDIIRFPYRDEISISHIEGAKELQRKSKRKELSLVLTNIVEKEFYQHQSEITIDLERHIAGLFRNLNVVIDAVESMKLGYNLNIHGLSKLMTGGSIINNGRSHISGRVHSKRA